MPEYLEQLRGLLTRYSVRSGDFVLASGQRSSLYVDAKLTTCRAAATRLVGRAFLEKMRQRGWRPAAIGGLSMGADPIAIAVARESLDWDFRIDAFLVRKEAKKHGRQRYLEGIEDPRGLDAVIVEDVCTTGESSITAVRLSREAGMNVLGAICLVDREQGARANLERMGCPFDSIFTAGELLGAGGAGEA